MYDTLGREALRKQLYHMIETLSIDFTVTIMIKKRENRHSGK